MTISGTGVVLCRLASIFYIVQALGFSGFLFQQLFNSSISGHGFIGVAAVAVVVPGVAAASVWYFAERISTLKTEYADSILGENVGTHQLVVIGTFLVGLCAVLIGIESGIRIEAVFWVQDATNSNSEVLLDRLPNRISYIVQIVLGTFLIVGRNMISRIFHWTRYAGRNAS